MMRETPNVLAAKTIFVQVKIGKKWVRCKVLRIHYGNAYQQRRIHLDVEATDTTHTDGQVCFLKIAMENLHHSYYPIVLAYSFAQEDADVTYRNHLKSLYAARLDMRLTQEYTAQDGYFWQGVLSVCQYPHAGVLYTKGETVGLAHFSFIGIKPTYPVVFLVKDRGKMQARTCVTITVGQGHRPSVVVDGEVISLSVRIGGTLYSGRERAIPFAL